MILRTLTLTSDNFEFLFILLSFDHADLVLLFCVKTTLNLFLLSFDNACFDHVCLHSSFNE